MYVTPVSAMGSGGIDPILRKRYAALNRELRKKRLKENEGIDSLDLFLESEVESNEPILTVEELREINSNPLWKKTPIKIAYTVLQRLCDETLNMPQNMEYLKIFALRVYKNH